MAPSTTQPEYSQVDDRPIPLVEVRRPKPRPSPSTLPGSSNPTTSPSTSASSNFPTSAHDSLAISSHECISSQTTCTSPPGDSVGPTLSPRLAAAPSTSATPQSILNDPAPPSSPSWLSFISPWDHRRTWVQNSIGVAGLAVALVGMFVYVLRGYKMAKWTTYNDLLNTCLSYTQVGRRSSLYDFC